MLPNIETVSDFEQEIKNLRYRVNLTGISASKKIIIQKALDFIIAILDDNQVRASSFLDIIYEFYSEE